MPEGDTLYRTATLLDKALHGDIVTGFATAFPAAARLAETAGVLGRRVAWVKSRGKHLLIALRAAERPSPPEPDPAGEIDASDLVLHTHLQMTGSWHVYRPQERWRKPEARAVVVLRTERFVVPCFSAPLVELLTAGQYRRHPHLTTLGPDAITEAFDSTRAAALPQASRSPVGVALMDQTLLAGVGNVYKSEILFLERTNPFLPAAELPPENIAGLIERARVLLQLNRDRGIRRTRFSLDPRERLWVYGRTGQPCRVCGETIRMRRQGEAARSTYYCPKCQGAR